MNAPVAVSADAEAPLSPPSVVADLSEIELVLALADLAADGFDAAVKSALDSAGGTLLFTMPAPDQSRVAAASIGAEGARRIVLFVLDADGKEVHVENSEGSAHPIAGLAASYAGVMDHLPAIAA